MKRMRRKKMKIKRLTRTCKIMEKTLKSTEKEVDENSTCFRGNNIIES